ncbi:MOG interacting and ectopic P-granules protein 1-like [Gigantopelta aegis]|uniref:MOG interacting and ectopic P-granules protein 1-like n=1 Tax=Gigantopelta aegis TaxID=1735272 RepID=UPI001B8880E9|nr:MOG interacting and ectopic P-granules protein 1-like [Gigantopelta aegis]
MEVDQHEQAMETGGFDSEMDTAVSKDGSIDPSKELGAKEKLSRSKTSDGEQNDVKDSSLIVGNGSRDSDDSCDSSKESSDGVDGELEKNSDKQSRQECVMNGDLSDHSSLSSSSEHDAESEKYEGKGLDFTEKSSTSSQNGMSVEVECTTISNSGIVPEDQSEKLSKDEEYKRGTESDDQSKESKPNEDNSLIGDTEESECIDDKANDETEGKSIGKDSERMDVEENRDDDDKISVSAECTDVPSKSDEDETEVSKSNESEDKMEVSTTTVEEEKSNKNGDRSEESKSDHSENDEKGSEAESCATNNESDNSKKDGKTESKPIEINDVEDRDSSSSNIMKDKRSIGDILSSKKDKSFSSESSLVGNPPFINVTYSARGPVPKVTSIGNNLLNTSSSVRMVVPSLKSQTHPQYQNQFQFYLQGPGGNNAKQYVSVLSTQPGIRAQDRQINNKPQEKIEPPRPPQSSMDMIELSRWEVKQGLHRRARNTKIRPESELSNLARFLRDFGQDLVKEAVYSDLVKIQQKRNAEGKLKTKEAEDFKKLRNVHQELHEKVGPCKVHFNRKCSCGFKTESINVMYSHKQRPHIDVYDMCCAYCSFVTRNPHAFKFHLEGEHNVKPIIEMKPPLWECNLCPYEHNIKNKLTQHKFKCTKNFKLHLNLHPAWMPGPEINFCLENMMYKLPVVKTPQAQMFNKPTIRAQPKIGPRPPAPRVSETIQQINAARAQAQQMMKFGGQRPGLAPNVNFFQNNSAMQRTPLRTVSSTLTGNRPGFHLNRMPTSSAMPLMMKQQIRNQTPKMSMVTPKSTTTNVTSKINHLISMNDTVLDISTKGQSNSGFEICEICGGYVKDRAALRIHFFYAHRIDMPYAVFDRIHPPLYCATCFSRFWTAQGLQKHLDVHKEDSSGGVAGKCVVCGHRVPNILMHMRIVHNKALNNFLKECKCIFCGTSFQNKTIVENHMAAIHGVVVKSGAPVESPSSNSPRQATEKQGQPSQKSGTALVKGSVCVLCNLNFGRNVDLTRHCMKVHHTCMKCGMVVADKLSLMKHTCLESAAGLRNCELCGEKGFHPAYHVKHIRDKHLKKCSVKVKKLLMDKDNNVNVGPSDRSVGKRKLPAADEVIDVDSQPSPIKKYKQCKESVRLYRESILLASDNDSDSSTSKKRKLRDTENQSEDDSHKSVKKAKTNEESQSHDKTEDKNTNSDMDTSDKGKAEETRSDAEVNPSGSGDTCKTDSLKTANKEEEKDTSENSDMKKSTQEAAASFKNSDDASESTQDKDEAVDSPSSSSEQKAKASPPPATKPESVTPQDESIANDGDSSSDEGDSSAFCGFQSLTKPDKDTDADIDIESLNSDSDSD